jgi:hypothetical protein
MHETEIIDSKELSERVKLPESWIRSHTRERCSKDQRIPHLQFGRYVRFEWNSPALVAWLNKHREGGAQ